MEDRTRDVEEESSEGGASWMTTFADLMSLLLTFFVLLLSFAQMDIIKFRDALGSVREAFGYENAAMGLNPNAPTSNMDFKYQKKDSFVDQPLAMPFVRSVSSISSRARIKENEEVLRKVRDLIAKYNLKDQVKAQRTGRGVVLRIKGKILFNSGSDVLKEESYPLLDDIISIAEQSSLMMSVEGHTDNRPISSEKFQSNWELSTARAISALRYIQKTGRIPEGKLGAAGYADTRPVASNDTPEGRQQNRRVEFIFYRE